jgi:hypothetical protein
MSARGPYGAWVLASLIAGGIVGLSVPCPPETWRSVFVLAATPAMVLAFFVRSFGGSPTRWLLTTAAGVALSTLATSAAFLLMSLLLNALLGGQAIRYPTPLGVISLAALGATACFIGAVPLGVLQLLALPRRDRRWQFVLAVMIGAAALAPLVLAVIGAPDCRGLFGPPVFTGALGGLVYGAATAAALREVD